MKTLTLRIYLTVVAVLLLFAVTSGWLFQRHLERERLQIETSMAERMAALGELIQRSLPGAAADPSEQSAALLDWSQRLRLPMALDSAAGQRLVASESYLRRGGSDSSRPADVGFAVQLEDGRTLWMLRPRFGRPAADSHDETRGGLAGGAAFRPGHLEGDRDGGGPRRIGPPPLPPFDLPFVPPAWQRGVGLLILLSVLFFAVAAGAWPVVGRLTRRLATLKQGVERFGSGQLSHRVEVTGNDEVAAVAASFNQAAGRIEALVRSHQSLLANASHELRSPLARMKMAVAMIEDAAPAQRRALKREIDTDVAELDALVEEVLLASRLDALHVLEQRERVDLLGLAAEEAARVGVVLVEAAPVGMVTAAADGTAAGPDMGTGTRADMEIGTGTGTGTGHPIGPVVLGDERLLRRALRNLLENARRYGGDDVSVEATVAGERALLRVFDRGPGVPQAERERIFEPFYRLPGHAEQAGGVGLGLSLVKQIAERHGATVRCTERDGGGSCFELSFPGAA